MKQVSIYTDGGCWPNPGGRAGFGVVMVYGEYRREISQGYRSSTNNRMEMMGVIFALEALHEPCDVTVYSDSQYLIKTMNGRFHMGKNKDLWNKILEAEKRHRVRWVWIRGHNGCVENERCDVLASRAMRCDDPLEDEGYGH